MSDDLNFLLKDALLTLYTIACQSDSKNKRILRRIHSIKTENLHDIPSSIQSVPVVEDINEGVNKTLCALRKDGMLSIHLKEGFVISVTKGEKHYKACLLLLF